MSKEIKKVQKEIMAVFPMCMPRTMIYQLDAIAKKNGVSRALVVRHILTDQIPNY